jgi:hypothetical protein
MKEDINSYIIEKLSRAASEDDLIFSICQKTGLGWENAKTLVEHVKDEHLTEIEAKQTPLNILVSFGFYIVGIVLILGPIFYLWRMLDVTSIFLVFISSESLDAETALNLLRSRCLLLSWFQLPSIFFTMLVGFGIINANLRYMRGIWEALFRKWKVIN